MGKFAKRCWLCTFGNILGAFNQDNKHHYGKFFMTSPFFSSFSFYFSLSHTCTLCKVEVFILVKHEGTRRRWGSIPLSLYYSTIVYLSICFFHSLHVIEIFMLLKHEGARRSWSSTPILSIIRPLPAFPPCLLVSIDLCLILRPLFILPFQHHYNQKSFPFCH